MATVQVSFQDDSTNEDLFRVYRSAAGQSPTGGNSELLATITYNTGTSVWDYTREVIDTAQSNDGVLTAPTTGAAPSTSGNTFTLRYSESNTGDFIYRVYASNAIGDSAPADSAAITLT